MKYAISVKGNSFLLGFKNRTMRLLTSTGFIAAISILLLNDFILKSYFGNFITGKLSDFAGTFAVAIFASAFLSSRTAIFFISLLFVWWKTPFSQPVIDLINSIGLGPIGRTIDYSDYVALVMLIPAKRYIDSVITRPDAAGTNFRGFVTILFSAISIFAFTATSFVNERSAWIRTHYVFNMTRADFENRIEKLPLVIGVKIEKETDVFPKDEYPDIETDPNFYFLEFQMQEKFCDSSEVKVSTSFRDEGEKQEIKDVNFQYWCNDPPTEDDKKRLVEMVEQHIIKPLSGIIQK